MSLSNQTSKPYISHNIGQMLLSSYWPLVIASLSLILIGLGLRDPWPADEPRFALIAKEMVETGQWFFPARAEELYPDKPPIFMWSIALIYWLTGSMRLSFLLPSALSAFLTITLVVDIARRLWDRKTGLIAGWLLLFSFQFTLQAKTAQIDAMVCAWMTVGSYGLLRYLLADGKYKWYLLAWFFMGIGVITKGVGFLPLLMLIPYGVYRLKAKHIPSIVNGRAWQWWLGPLAMLFAISLWLIPLIVMVMGSYNAPYQHYLDNILLKQTVTRYADSWHHIKPAWYYLVSVIPLFWLPVSLAIPSLIKPWAKAWKSLDPRIILPLGYVILVIIFFSISPGKRGVYVLPALPMFVLAAAPYYKQLFQTKWIVNLVFAITVSLSLVLMIVALMGLSGLPILVQYAEKIELAPWLFFLTVGVSGLVGLLLTWKNNRLLAWPVFISILWVLYSTYGYQLRNEVSTPIAIYKEVGKHINADAKIAFVDFSEQFILFSPYQSYHFGYHTDPQRQLLAAYQWQKDENQYVLIQQRLIDDKCYDVRKSIDLGFAHRRHWYLLTVDAKRVGCEDPHARLHSYFYRPSNK